MAGADAGWATRHCDDWRAGRDRPVRRRRSGIVAGTLLVNVQVPAGYVYGLPVGISFYGRAFTEPKLIRLAYAYEQATHHRRPPRLLPSAELRG